MRSQQYQEECIDFIALFGGFLGYILVTTHGWKKIYNTDLLYNNITSRVEANMTFDIQEDLKMNNIILAYGIPVMTVLLWTWCYLNRYCARYYALIVPFVWCSMVFCESMLHFYWETDRFMSSDGFPNPVHNPDDMYLHDVYEALVFYICLLPSILCIGFIIRHSINYKNAHNIHLNVPRRYPKSCSDIIDATCLDMYEFFIIPVMNILFVFIMFIIVCCTCLESGEGMHYDSGVQEVSSGELSEKNLGFVQLERKCIVNNPFDRMI